MKNHTEGAGPPDPPVKADAPGNGVAVVRGPTGSRRPGTSKHRPRETPAAGAAIATWIRLLPSNAIPITPLDQDGGRCRDRTYDLLDVNQVFYY